MGVEFTGNAGAWGHERGQTGVFQRAVRPAEESRAAAAPGVWLREGAGPHGLRDAAARDNIVAASTRMAFQAGLFELVLAAPALSPADSDTLEAHIGRYNHVAQSVFAYGRGDSSAWER